MKRVFIFIIVSITILSGCNNDDVYNNAIQKGLDHIASEEYQKAEGAFELALEEKENDKKATNFLHQTVSYQEAERAFKDADFELAEEKSKEVIKLEGYSSALVKKSENILESINELKSTLADVESDYEDASKQYEDKNFEEANTITEDILSKDLKHSFFEPVVKDTEELQEDIKASQADADRKKADADRKKADADRKKADAEKKEKEEKSAQANKKDNKQDEDDYINSVSPHNKDKDIFSENGYAVYYEDGETFDAHTDEIVLHNHEMYSDHNVDTVLGWIDELYEPGMNKNDLKEVLYSNVEASEDEINKAIDIYWDEKL